MRHFLLSMGPASKLFPSHFSGVFFFYILDDLLSAEQGKIIQNFYLDFTFLIYIYLVEDVCTVCWMILSLHRRITYLYK